MFNINFRSLLTRGGAETLNGALVALSIFGLVAIKTEIDTKILRDKMAAAAAEAEVLKRLPLSLREEIKKLGINACIQMLNQGVPLSKDLLALLKEGKLKDGQRKLRLKGFELMLSCTELLQKEPELSDESLKQLVLNYGNLCVQINQKFDKSREGFHPLLLWFYKDLKNKLCQPAVVKRLRDMEKEPSFKGFGVPIQSILELIEKLKNQNEAEKSFSIFNAKQDMGVFCIRMLDTVIQKDKDLQILLNYILLNKGKLTRSRFPQLKKIFDDLEIKARGKGVKSEELIKIDSGKIQAFQGTICTTDEGKEMIRSKESQIFPLIKELLELLSDDISSQAKELEILFLDIFNKIKDF